MKLVLLIVSVFVQATLYAQLVQKPSSPDKLFGQLFIDVQTQKVFADGKTFVDCTPKSAPAVIMHQYNLLKDQPAFSLKKFVENHFSLPQTPPVLNYVQHEQDIVKHITRLWSVLKRKPDVETKYSSLLPLPYPYVVPGGRFREMYYWDSYFTMLGLMESGDTLAVENMIDNFAFLITNYGHIPNGNRTYYLSRSQPPFFALMIELLAKAKSDNKVYAKYRAPLQQEYDYWMKGSNTKAAKSGYSRVFKLPDGTVLNRYWDDVAAPRPESYLEDVETANKKLNAISAHHHLSKKDEQIIRTDTYYDLKAGAESGWDFSSRWLKDTFNLTSIETTNFVPVDLNCLMYALEQTLIKALENDKGSSTAIENIRAQSSKRKDAINTLCWNTDKNFYVDYNFCTCQPSNIVSAAGLLPFFTGIAPNKYLSPVISTLKSTLLGDGGVVSTPFTTGQQWDAPNGWAPQQWMAIKGLEDYGEKELAKEIANRWIKLNVKTYHNTGRLMEKYNVINMNLDAGGGEYPTQDGFGWTNGVLLALIKQYGLPAAN